MDVVNDTDLPSIVLVIVRNPYRRSEQAVGYLLWYRGVDLRMQGTAFPPCIRPRVRSWWNGRQGSPYSTAIVYETRGNTPMLGFKYLQLSGDGYYWNLLQYEGSGPELGVAGEAAFVDVDGDGRPELLSYSPVPQDSILTVRSPVGPILREVGPVEPEPQVLHRPRAARIARPVPVAAARREARQRQAHARGPRAARPGRRRRLGGAQRSA